MWHSQNRTWRALKVIKRNKTKAQITMEFEWRPYSPHLPSHLPPSLSGRPPRLPLLLKCCLPNSCLISSWVRKTESLEHFWVLLQSFPGPFSQGQAPMMEALEFPRDCTLHFAAPPLSWQACEGREGIFHSPRVQICHWQQVSEPQVQQWAPLAQPRNIYNHSKQSSGREKQTVSSGS